MTTVRDRIDAAIGAALGTVLPAASIEFEPEGDANAFPGLAIYVHGDQSIEREAVIDRRSLELTVEGYVAEGGGTDGKAARNDLHSRAVAALMADDTLGGLVELIEPGDRRNTRLEFDQIGRLTFAQDFTLQFTTSRRDPAVAY